jgi:DNA-binding MarR family transcriptional regulator
MVPQDELGQMDLAYSIEKPDWVALKILTEEIQDELSQNRYNLLYCLSNWFMAVTIFKRFEERQMVIPEPSQRDKDYHRVVLTGILANGEKLLHELTRHQEVDTKNIGIQLVDVEAAVNEIRLCYAEWFGQMKPERQKAILKEAFGVTS